jgi:hypothetical protein
MTGASEIVWGGRIKAKPGGPPLSDPRFNAQLGAHYEGTSGEAVGTEAGVLSVEVESKTVRPIALHLSQDVAYPSGRVGGGPVVNGGVRARVSYSAGLSGKLTFDCDWRGGLLVHAQQLDVARVAYNPDPISGTYGAQPVKLAATALIGGEHPQGSPTYTVPPAPVLVDATRTIALPLLASRVQLLAIYGNGGASGDAPLGQWFLAFISSWGGVLHWIDALSSREALFGGGLAIPHGTAELALTNSSADASVCFGALFHLAV